MSTLASNQRDAFDPVSCHLIDKVCRYTGAKIVISSTWREGRSGGSMCDILRYNGIDRCHIHSDWATPVLRDARQKEIDAWLKGREEITHWEILDDGIGLDENSPRLVQPEFDDGLAFEHVLALLAILDGDAEQWFKDAGVKFTQGDTDTIAKIQGRINLIG